MNASNENDAVKDGLETELREYALNPYVKVEITSEPIIPVVPMINQSFMLKSEICECNPDGTYKFEGDRIVVVK